MLSVRRDTVSREIRLELADWRTRTGGVYDLAPTQQDGLMLAGHLPHWGDFLPDFVIVLAVGDPVTVPGVDGAPVESVTWRDLRVHVGGVRSIAVGPQSVRTLQDSASAQWQDVDSLLGRRARHPGAPDWLLGLIREHTPWGVLLDR